MSPSDRIWLMGLAAGFMAGLVVGLAAWAYESARRWRAEARRASAERMLAELPPGLAQFTAAALRGADGAERARTDGTPSRETELAPLPGGAAPDGWAGWQQPSPRETGYRPVSADPRHLRLVAERRE